MTGWLADLDVTVTAFATHIGVSRPMLSRVLKGRSAVRAATLEDLRAEVDRAKPSAARAS